MKPPRKFLGVIAVLVAVITLAVGLITLQQVWDAILAVLPNQEPDTANSIAGWLQGFATIVALYFTYRALVVTANEAHASNAALQHQQQAAVEQARPRVVVDFVQHPNGDGADYYAKNVGPGAALNVYVVADPTSDATAFNALGGLLHGERERVHPSLRNALARQAGDPLDREPVYIVAEPATGTEWMLSINRMQGDNRLVHEVIAWKPTAAMLARLKALTINEQLRQHLAQMAPQADNITEAAGGLVSDRPSER